MLWLHQMKTGSPHWFGNGITAPRGSYFVKIIKGVRLFVTDMWISFQHWLLREVGRKREKRKKCEHFYFRERRKSVVLLEDTQVLPACPYSNAEMKTLEWWRVMAWNPFEKWLSSKLCLRLPLLHHREHTFCALLNQYINAVGEKII